MNFFPKKKSLRRILAAVFITQFYLFSNSHAVASCLDAYRTNLTKLKKLRVGTLASTATCSGVGALFPPLLIWAGASAFGAVTFHQMLKSTEKAKHLIQGAYAYLNYPHQDFSIRLGKLDPNLYQQERQKLIDHFLKLAREMKIQKGIDFRDLASLIVEADQRNYLCTYSPNVSTTPKKILKNMIRKDNHPRNLWRLIGRQIPSDLSKSKQKEMKKMLEEKSKPRDTMRPTEIPDNTQNEYNNNHEKDTDRLLAP